MFTLSANDVNGVTKIISDGAAAPSTKTTSIVLLIGGMLVALATRRCSRGRSRAG